MEKDLCDVEMMYFNLSLFTLYSSQHFEIVTFYSLNLFFRVDIRCRYIYYRCLIIITDSRIKVR